MNGTYARFRVVHQPAKPRARQAYDAIFARVRANRRNGDVNGDLHYRLLSRGAFPDNFGPLLEALASGRQEAIDPAIAWLEVDPFCLYSGYAKQKVMRSLAKVKLSSRQANKVQRLLVGLVQRGPSDGVPGRLSSRQSCQRS